MFLIGFTLRIWSATLELIVGGLPKHIVVKPLRILWSVRLRQVVVIPLGVSGDEIGRIKELVGLEEDLSRFLFYANFA